MSQAEGISLKFSLDQNRIKHFKTALQCLAKIGSELLIEGIPERLVLRCINTSKSAFMAVTFQNSFFETYDIFNSTVVQSAVLVKHVMACFRTQRMSKVTFDLQIDRNSLSATLQCDRGIVKMYSLPCIDAEVLQATVEKESLPTHVVAEAKELNRLLSSFQSSLEEMTIIANPETAANPHSACQMRSFIDPTKFNSDNTLHTSIQMDTRTVFLSYEHQADEASDVTFNLKDLRAIVTFCEAMGANISLRFEGPGMPLLAEPNFSRGMEEAYYTAELVLATLMDSQIEQPSASRPAADPTPTRGLRTPGDVAGDTPFRTPAAAAARRGGGVKSLHTGATAGGDRRSRMARPEPTQQHPAPAAAHPATLLQFNRDGSTYPAEEVGQEGEWGADEEDEDEDMGLEGDADPQAAADRSKPEDFDEGQEGDELDELPATPPEAYAPVTGPVIIG